MVQEQKQLTIKDLFDLTRKTAIIKGGHWGSALVVQNGWAMLQKSSVVVYLSLDYKGRMNNAGRAFRFRCSGMVEY